MPQTRLASAKAFEESSGTAKDPGILLYTYRAWGTVFYQEGKHTDAARVWTEALTKTPDRSELLNNLAYVTARFLTSRGSPARQNGRRRRPRTTRLCIGHLLGTAHRSRKLDEADAAFKKTI